MSNLNAWAKRASQAGLQKKSVQRESKALRDKKEQNELKAKQYQKERNEKRRMARERVLKNNNERDPAYKYSKAVRQTNITDKDPNRYRKIVRHADPGKLALGRITKMDPTDLTKADAPNISRSSQDR